jgi:hypothetical protein
MRTSKKMSVDFCKKYLEKQIIDVLCKRKITDEISNDGYSATDHLFDVYNLTNDCVAKNLHSNIVEALKVVTLERVWKYERKTRDYRRMYVDIAKKVELGKIKSEDINYNFLEESVKKYKTHRSMIDIESNFIDTS